MPTYEYRCRDCGHSFDIVQKMSDEQLTHCPECGGALRKVFTAPAISFKGSGFYATDHGQKTKEPSEKTTEKTKEPSEKTTEKKGEKKEEKTGSKPSESSATAATMSCSKVVTLVVEK